MDDRHSDKEFEVKRCYEDDENEFTELSTNEQTRKESTEEARCQHDGRPQRLRAETRRTTCSS
eukprot:15928217-Heterocapsa_arctica.AAC.1